MTVFILKDKAGSQHGKVSGERYYEWKVCQFWNGQWLVQREETKCGPVMIVNIPGTWRKNNTAQCYGHVPAEVSRSSLTRELCCAELTTILTASLTMADNRADVHAEHIWSLTPPHQHEQPLVRQRAALNELVNWSILWQRKKKVIRLWELLSAAVQSHLFVVESTGLTVMVLIMSDEILKELFINPTHALLLDFRVIRE